MESKAGLIASNRTSSSGKDVIAFSPVVETGFEPVLQEAEKAGIPVVLSDPSL